MNKEELIYELRSRDKIIEKIKYWAGIDSLTKVFNRRYGLKLLEDKVKIAKLNNSFLTIGFIDVNKLKCINDKYGHNEGDKVLSLVGEVIKKNMKKEDFIFRFGGDEFVMVFLGKDLNITKVLYNIMDNKLKEQTLSYKYEVSLSVGFAQLEKKCLSCSDLICVADQNMYKNKYDNVMC
ncbi:GGDEF domain-containing protein [Clostridium niameyense]|nr:GGDEF domain-containing protein [Clostridium niameyense]